MILKPCCCHSVPTENKTIKTFLIIINLFNLFANNRNKNNKVAVFLWALATLAWQQPLFTGYLLLEGHHILGQIRPSSALIRFKTLWHPQHTFHKNVCVNVYTVGKM